MFTPSPAALLLQIRRLLLKCTAGNALPHPPITSTMTGRGGGGGRRVLLPPINFIFKLLQQHQTVQIWLYEQLSIRIEGKIRVCDFALSSDSCGTLLTRKRDRALTSS